MNNTIPQAAQFAAETLGINLGRLRYLDGFLQKLVEKGDHSFLAFHVLRRGSLVFCGNYGVRTTAGEPLTEDAIYCVASVTKPIVATCCAILQEDGLIDFNDKVQTYFPGFVGEGKENVLLWHLLTHVSGMDEEAVGKFIDEYLKNEIGVTLTENSTEDERFDALMAARDKMGLPKMERGWDAVNNTYWELELKAPLAIKTGTGYSYYNSGYEMLAQIIERISGQSLERFATERVFEPLGMVDSHWILPKEKYSRYVRRDPSFKGGEWFSGDYVLSSTSAAGGLKTTMTDLLRFGQMYLQNGTVNGNRILSPASIRLITQDHNEGLPDSFWRGYWLGTNWGFGWDVKNGKKDDLGMLRSDRSYNHCGYGGARLHVDPDADVVIALYMVEQREEDYCPNMSNAANVLYSALD